MPTSSPTPPVPTPGSSPLVERIGTEVTQINIVPGFGKLLQVVLHGSTGMPEVMHGAVEAVTVYGDGRIEYHSAPAQEPPFTQCPVCHMHTNAGDHSHPETGGRS